MDNVSLHTAERIITCITACWRLSVSSSCPAPPHAQRGPGGVLTCGGCPDMTWSRDHSRAGRLLLMGFSLGIQGIQSGFSFLGWVCEWPTGGFPRTTPGMSSMVSRERPMERGVKPRVKPFRWAQLWNMCHWAPGTVFFCLVLDKPCWQVKATVAFLPMFGWSWLDWGRAVSPLVLPVDFFGGQGSRISTSGQTWCWGSRAGSSLLATWTSRILHSWCWGRELVWLWLSLTWPGVDPLEVDWDLWVLRGGGKALCGDGWGCFLLYVLLYDATW